MCRCFLWFYDGQRRDALHCINCVVFPLAVLLLPSSRLRVLWVGRLIGRSVDRLVLSQKNASRQHEDAEKAAEDSRAADGALQVGIV